MKAIKIKDGIYCAVGCLVNGLPEIRRVPPKEAPNCGWLDSATPEFNRREFYRLFGKVGTAGERQVAYYLLNKREKVDFLTKDDLPRITDEKGEYVQLSAYVRSLGYSLMTAKRVRRNVVCRMVEGKRHICAKKVDIDKELNRK